MRRLIRLWHRHQRAITTTPATPRVEDAAAQPAPMPEPAPAPPVDWSGYDINAAVDAIVANHIPALPRRVQQVVRETARAIRSDLTGPIFAADNLRLMDDPLIADIDWVASIFQILEQQKRAISMQGWAKLRCFPWQIRPWVVIYAPADWREDEGAMRSVESAILGMLRSTIYLPVWDHLTWHWQPSDAPAWAVSIAAVDAPMEGVA